MAPKRETGGHKPNWEVTSDEQGDLSQSLSQACWLIARQVVAELCVLQREEPPVGRAQVPAGPARRADLAAAKRFLFPDTVVPPHPSLDIKGFPQHTPFFYFK